MKKLLATIFILLTASVAYSAITAIPRFANGFALQDGTKLNAMVDALNNLTGFGTPQAITGTTGTFSGKLVTGNIPPVVSACGTSPSIVGSNTGGQLTTGSTATTSCVMTWAAPGYVGAPFCSFDAEGAANTGLFTVTTNTNITLTYTSATSQKFNYICVARSGG